MKKQPIKDENTPERVVRGGTWYYEFRYVRISDRFINESSNRYKNPSFRIVRSKDKKQ